MSTRLVRIITIKNLTMRNGSSSEGGAIRVAGNRADNLAGLYLIDCDIISSSSSGHGGGIHARNALVEAKSTTLITGNSAGSSGGGIWADASTVNVIGGSTLTYNTASLHGGSIHAIDSALKLENAAVTHSTATQDGGGIAYFYGNGRTVTLSFVVANDNRTSRNGGALYANLNNATVNISVTTFYNNTSQSGSNDWYFEGNGSALIDGTTVF